MDSKEVVKEVQELSKKISIASQETKCNQQKCKTLAARIVMVSESLDKTAATPAREPLSRLNTILNDALHLIRSNDSKNYLVKALHKNTAQIEFQTIQQGMFSLIQLLHLQVSTEEFINEQQDAQDEEQDRNDLKELFNKFLQNQDYLKEELQEQTKKIPLDRALSSIKIQLEKLNSGKHIEISPSELRLIQKIGAGSYGEVWKASYAGNLVAVKMLLSCEITDSFVQMFKEELETVSQLNHPNVARLYGASTLNKNQLALIFDYYPTNLYNLIHADKKHLDLPVKMKLAFGIAQGLEYLHEKNLLHKDLKSANILLDAQLTPKISDVGMTTAKKFSLRLKPPHVWMAPELFDKKPNLTLKVDIYSFGILLWELITQQFPFEIYKDPAQVALAVREGNRPEIPSDFPSELVGLVTSCWDETPEKRLSIGEVVKMLKPLLPAETPHATESAHSTKVADKKKKKNKDESATEETHKGHETSKTEATKTETKTETKAESNAEPKQKKPKEDIPAEIKTSESTHDDTSKTQAPKTETKTESTEKQSKKSKEEAPPESTKAESTEATPQEKTSKKSSSKKSSEKTPKPAKDSTAKSGSGKPKEKKEGGCCIVM